MRSLSYVCWIGSGFLSAHFGLKWWEFALVAILLLLGTVVHRLQEKQHE